MASFSIMDPMHYGGSQLSILPPPNDLSNIYAPAPTNGKLKI